MRARNGSGWRITYAAPSIASNCLFVAERDHRVNARRAAGGQPDGQERHQAQEDGHRGEHCRVLVFDAEKEGGEQAGEREHHRLVYGALLKVNEGDKVKAGQLLAEWDAFAMPILSEVGGIIKFGDIVEGVTMTEKLDEVTGLSRKVIVESRAADLRPRISIKSLTTGETLKLPNSMLDARYLLPVGANIVVQDGDQIGAGDVLAKID